MVTCHYHLSTVGLHRGICELAILTILIYHLNVLRQDKASTSWMSGRGPYEHPPTQNHHSSNPANAPRPRELSNNQSMSSTCETCDRVTPPTRTQCEFCSAKNVKQFTSDSSDAMDESWSYGRVVLAVVPASNRYLAAALGSAAFGFSIHLSTRRTSHIATCSQYRTSPRRRRRLLPATGSATFLRRYGSTPNTGSGWSKQRSR